MHLLPSEANGTSTQNLYLDLLKDCLLDKIHIDDPLAAYEIYRSKPETPPVKRYAVEFLRRLLDRYRLRLVEPGSTPWIADLSSFSNGQIEEMRDGGRDWPLRAHTMIGRKRLDNLQSCLVSCLDDGVPGDFVETGVWRGGASIFARGVLKAYGVEDRTVWLADSFSGLPPPDAATYEADAGDRHHLWSDRLAVSQEQVARNFERYALLDAQVRFLKGWFKDTLPTAPIERIAVLRLDGDMYESTIQALDALYPKLSPGGYVIVDDYFLAPCAKAVHDFRTRLGISDEIVDIDGMGSYWRRPRG